MTIVDERMEDGATRPDILGDAQFLIALSLGPMYWLARAVVYGEPSANAARVFETPLGWLQVVLVYPLLEEIVFRGGVQDFFRRRLHYKRWSVLSAANLMTSLLFAAAHVAWRGDTAAVAVFLPSLVFGYFRERHATLASPIALHVFYNAGLFALAGVQ